MTEDDDRDELSVYLVFTQPDDELVQAARSLAGAGAALIAYAAGFCGTADLVMQDGQPFRIEVIATSLPMDGVVYIRALDGDEPIASIERRFLAP
ncbi:hypothetical protein [Sphingomonas zeae]|uniref:Uncharacterized protein n=1 Tax=Sphingomonas zeae TaxID=1646122 RepID=A0A7Y6B241_9SPHN|nr:hypothetical protein [Sphingomonas zeae]MBB4049653.1 hypothetical protein [Sphingomonas zeae]NUU46034.1 hypothetical protein [Sphingomonas zeae]